MRTNRWYMGVVRAYHDADGTYSIDYDDGASEEGVAPQHVQVLEEEADDEDDVAARAEGGSGEARAVGEVEEELELEAPAAEAEGLRLHLSSNNATG